LERYTQKKCKKGVWSKQIRNWPVFSNENDDHYEVMHEGHGQQNMLNADKIRKNNRLNSKLRSI
jgi:hypothetical protein